MFFIPVDLFSPYIQGREMAIDRNWNDLNQSNQVEQGWLNNDASRLNNWFSEDTYGDRLASSNANGRIAQNRAMGSDLETDIARAGQPGALAQATMASDYYQALRDAMRPYAAPVANNNALFTYGQSVDRAAQGNAAIATAPQLRTATANNNVAAANLQSQVIRNNADLLPLQQNVQRGNLQLQQVTNDYLQQNPQSLFPQTQTTASGSMDSQIYSQAASLPAGSTTQLDIGGSPVNAGRDDSGVYVMENGQKRYISPTSTTTISDTIFSFGGLK